VVGSIACSCAPWERLAAIRQIVRGEAVITAVMGAVIGICVGVLFGVLVSRPLGEQGLVLALPRWTLAALLALGALAGVLATDRRSPSAHASVRRKVLQRRKFP
jgi:hypothetical protein